MHCVIMPLPFEMKKILIIQTAFIGDVILATPLAEKLHAFFPGARIDFLVRKGNEGLLKDHPFLNEVLVWNKNEKKIRNLFRLIRKVKATRYDLLVNAHRFASSGLLAFFSGARVKTGFDKNPFSFCYDWRVQHQIGNHVHEIQRNLALVEKLTDAVPVMPRLYPGAADVKEAGRYSRPGGNAVTFITIAPTSVWFTKQLPAHKWLELIEKQNPELTICLLGAKGDAGICEEIRKSSAHPNILNLAGKLTFLQSAALMKEAKMNYVNDSAPLHMASAMNAPVTAVFCSTVPAFGFGPLSDESFIVESNENLSCRPCGLHGFRACPKGHFKCAEGIRF